MKSLIKTIGFTILFTLTIPSYTSYRYTTIEPCIPKYNSKSYQDSLKTENYTPKIAFSDGLYVKK